MKTMTKWYLTAKQRIENERGAQALEWLGLAALLVMALGLISTALSKGDAIQGIIDKVFKAIGDQIK